MAVIALSGNTLGCSLGLGSFGNVGSAFTTAKESAGGLSYALKSLSSKINMVSVTINVSTSQEQVSKAYSRETEKQSTLSLAYEKLDVLVSDVGIVDEKVSCKIHQRKDDFYNRYNYLKPDCEKTKKELRAEHIAEGWENFKNWCSGVVESAKNIAKNVVEWVKDNFIAIITAIGVLLVAVLVVVLTPLGAVFVACVAGIIGLVLSALNFVVTCCNDGKGIAELLAENGHPVLAQMFSGFQWGLDLVEFVLPLGAMAKAISKVGFKQFFKTSWTAMKKTCKETFEAVFKSGFKNGCKNALKIVAKKFLFDWDNLKPYKGYENYGEVLTDLLEKPAEGLFESVYKGVSKIDYADILKSDLTKYVLIRSILIKPTLIEPILIKPILRPVY